MRTPRLLASLVLAGCAGAGTAGHGVLPLVAGAGSAGVQAPLFAGATNPGHLYVVDLFQNTIFRFRLRDGVPARSPESSITGLAGPNSLVVGPDGDLYVSDRNGVKVFAPNATGNALPLRELPANYVARLAVDARGYLYAGVSGTPPLIAVYAPGAGGVDQPIQTIVAPGSETRVPDLGLAVDAQGNLYASVDPAASQKPTIVVYGDPTTDPTVIRQTCAAESFDFFESLAIGPRGFLYASRGNGVSEFPDTVNACPAPPHRTFTSPKQPFSAIRGIAVGGTRLFVGDFINRPLNTGAVFEFDTQGDPHRPIAVLYGASAQFTTIDDVALGP